MRTVKVAAALCLFGLTELPLRAQDTAMHRRAVVRIQDATHRQVVPRDLQRTLRSALGLPATSSVRFWQRATGKVEPIETAAIPYLIFIEALSPAPPAPHQEIRVRFRLRNLVGGPISGLVRADIDGQRLVATTAATINSLKPGEDAVGELWTSGRDAGVHVAHVSFANAVISSGSAGYNPYDPKTLPYGAGSAGPFLTEDSQEFTIGALDPILTSPDIPSGGPATAAACGDTNATFGPSISVPKEWAAVTSEDIAIPAVGTVVARHLSGNDFPFAHPFGWDIDFYLAPDPQWTSLLTASSAPAASACKVAAADHDYCEAMDSAASRGIKDVGILGVETDSQLLAPAYRPVPGDRVVVHGAWIVDCGHLDHHTEIHPPTLVATARVRGSAGQLFATFVGQPYRSRQTYQGDNATFLAHALGQVAQAEFNPGVTQIAALPNMETMAFSGLLVAQYRLALPPTVVFYTESAVRYHFVTRPGVTVSVQQPDKYHLNVAIVMDASQYKPPPLPACRTNTYSAEDAEQAAGWSPGTLRGALIAVPASAPVADFLGMFVGVPPGTFEALTGKVDVSLNAGILQLACTVSAPPSPSLTASDNAVITDMSQPYPVAGWVMMDWTPDRIAQMSPAGLKYQRSTQLHRRPPLAARH